MRIIEYLVTEPEGLHALPAAALFEKINQYDCEITAQLGNHIVNAKSPFGLMALGARYGDVIIFRIDGQDEDIVNLQ
ncbi:MAG: HPr family phosphocarrier protein [Pseudobutyrivibrio sp.]|nr:HPr family phosphocarrier protein [Pseudobutyrivibrio sp.]